MKEKVICPLCRQEFRTLTNSHFRFRHKLDIQDWRKGYKGSLWGELAIQTLAGNKHAKGHRHSAAFKKRFKAAVSKPRPAHVKLKIKQSHLKLAKTPERQEFLKRTLAAAVKSISYTKAEILKASREWKSKHPGANPTALRRAHRGWDRAVIRHFGSWPKLWDA